MVNLFRKQVVMSIRFHYNCPGKVWFGRRLKFNEGEALGEVEVEVEVEGWVECLCSNWSFPHILDGFTSQFRTFPLIFDTFSTAEFLKIMVTHRRTGGRADP